MVRCCLEWRGKYDTHLLFIRLSIVLGRYDRHDRASHCSNRVKVAGQALKAALRSSIEYRV
jgi:hypothetical protein